MFSNFDIYRRVWNNYHYNTIHTKFSSAWVEDNLHIHIDNMDYWSKHNNTTPIFSNDCTNNHTRVFNHYAVPFAAKMS